MAVPKKKPSKSRSRMRRNANSGLTLKNISFNKETGEAFLSHNITPKGFYAGELIISKEPKEKNSETSSSE